MSLNNAAQHLASQGRGPDSMLVHMSPREVHGLQALAEQHGTSLTINPTTGLPEALSLNDILPAVAGFALDYFLPGVGQAVGGALGLGQAAGTAITVGGLAGLSSGSLSEGIMAGMGAYGGAGLHQGLMGLGSAGNLAQSAADADMAGGLIPAGEAGNAAYSASTAPTDTLSKLKAGASAAMDSPKDFLKDQSGNLFKAFGPAVLGGFASNNDQTGAPPTQTSPGYIREYATDPVTGAMYQVSATPTAEFGSRSAVTFGGVPQSTRYAGGGTVGKSLGRLVWNPETESYDSVSSSGTVIPADSVQFGGVGESTNVNDPTDKRSDSEKAYDYLMGVPGAKNPMLFTHQEPEKQAIVPLDLYTREGGHYVYNEETGAYDWLADTAAGGGAGDAGLGALYKANNAGVNAGGFDAGSTTDSSNTTGPGLATMGMNGIAAIAEALGLATAPAAMTGMAPVSDMSTFSPAAQAQANEQAQIDANDALSESQAQAAVDAMNADAAMGDTGVGTASNPGLGVDGISTGNDGGGGAPDGGAGGQGSDGVGPSGPGGPGGPGVGDAPDDARGGFYSGGRFDNRAAAHYAYGGIANLSNGGLGSLGGYSDGGQLLRGPGDGVSDGIPATIGRGQPARLADGEFVVPARIVSELGNGSTAAGAKQLYAMMARIQKGRAKTIGKNKVATNSKAARHLPA